MALLYKQIFGFDEDAVIEHKFGIDHLYFFRSIGEGCKELDRYIFLPQSSLCVQYCVQKDRTYFSSCTERYVELSLMTEYFEREKKKHFMHSCFVVFDELEFIFSDNFDKILMY